jgi:hypothetical protein
MWKTDGHSKPMTAWNVLLQDRRPGYISWAEFEANQRGKLLAATRSCRR